jgi:hypothetical protein
VVRRLSERPLAYPGKPVALCLGRGDGRQQHLQILPLLRWRYSEHDGLAASNSTKAAFEAASWIASDADVHFDWQEYIAGTAPTNGLDFFQLSISGNALHVSTVSNRNYAVRSVPMLGGAEASPPGQTPSAPPDWNVFTTFPGLGTPVALPLGPTNGTMFYRLEVELP